ncbi:MAG: type II secretion system GspH family protein [Desulfobacterales bacterium]|nr:type II secretion system GspH family protein [Desulfobacterales bacterium]
MKKERGFTLIELMVVVAILGVLGATAMPLYNTWQQRAYGSEAIVMMKQLTEGQILYYLENDEYFPGSDETEKTFQVLKDGVEIPGNAVIDIQDALKLTITPNGRLDYIISNNGDNSCTITIKATFPLFRNGQKSIMVLLNEKGFVEYFTLDDLGVERGFDDFG